MLHQLTKYPYAIRYIRQPRMKPDFLIYWLQRMHQCISSVSTIQVICIPHKELGYMTHILLIIHKPAFKSCCKRIYCKLLLLMKFPISKLLSIHSANSAKLGNCHWMVTGCFATTLYSPGKRVLNHLLKANFEEAP